jgi:hypothetical protein
VLCGADPAALATAAVQLPDIFQGEDMFAWKPVQEDLRHLRLLLVESDLALIYPLTRAQRLREADHLLEEMHDLWWRYNRQDREFANAWCGAIMRHADASAASGNYEQVPKAIAVLHEIAGNFPEGPAFRTYSSRLSLNAVKHASGRAGLAEAARLHADFATSSHRRRASRASWPISPRRPLCYASPIRSTANGRSYSRSQKPPHGPCAPKPFVSELSQGGETTWTETAQWLDGGLQRLGESVREGVPAADEAPRRSSASVCCGAGQCLQEAEALNKDRDRKGAANSMNVALSPPRCRGARAKSLLCNSRLTPARPGA